MDSHMTQITQARAALVFGTDTGNTEEIGDKICQGLAERGVAVEMVNIVDISSDFFNDYDLIIMGIPTWDFGGIQEDWEEQEDTINDAKLSNKTVALYGLGDQLGYGDYFLDAVGWLHQRTLAAGARMIGYWSTEGYDFEASLGANSDKTLFLGLAIDEDQQFELTDIRIAAWLKQICQEYQQLVAA